MKFAVRITEVLTRTVVVEASNYEEAEDKVMEAYGCANLQLNADNAAVEVDYSDETANYIELIGKTAFYSLEVSDEVK